MSDAVRDQYEAYPYPARDPGDEKRRLIGGSPSHRLEIDHFLFAGGREAGRPLRALVAGGGTGDGAIMLAQQLADAGDGGSVDYIDLSEASSAIAQARAEMRGLTNIRFRRLSLLELPSSGLGQFDYIDCCGVLHHLDDPAAGLAALVAVLAPGGGLGLMLYGALGRTGVYPLQDVLRSLGAGLELAERVGLARRLLADLPATNWFVRNGEFRDHLDGGDAGLVDLLLHPRDRAYGVGEIVSLLDGAGLVLASFSEPARYDPLSYVADPEVRRRLAGLTGVARWAAAENLAGNIRTHVFYALRRDESAGRVASPDDTRLVPVVRELDVAAVARHLRQGGRMRVPLDGFTLRLELPAAAGDIVGAIDGRRSIADIHRLLAARPGGYDGFVFHRHWCQAFDALHGLGKLFLRRPAGR